jgi:O-antigen/teichoic acid export membrane protein
MTPDPTRTVWRRISSDSLARIGKNALALLAAQAGAKLLNLVLTAQLTRTLGVAALGRYLLALTVETVTLAVADLGINVYAVRDLARAFPISEAGSVAAGETKKTTQDPHMLWGAMLALKLLAALCCTLALNVVVAPLIFPGERRALIAIASLALLPDAFNGIATALLKARQRMEISSTINLATRLAAAIAGVLLLRWGKDERAVLLSYVATSLLGSCAFVGVLWAWRVRAHLAGLWRHWHTVLRESVPFAITGMVAMLYSRIDLLMLAYWQGDLAAGLYGAAYRVWEALGMLPVSLLDALFPELSRVSAQAKGYAHLRALYRRGRMFVWLLLVLVVVPCFALAPHLMALLYGRSADTAVVSMLFRALLFAFPFTYLYLLNGHLLYAIGQQLWVTRAMIAATTANGVLNALVIPRWGSRGAVGVAILSQVLLYALLRRIAKQYALHAADEPAQLQREKRL